MREDEVVGGLQGVRQALVDGRQRWEGGVRLGLVPVGDGGVVVVAVVGVAVLDGHPDGFFERNGVRHVEAVDRGLGPGLEVVLLEGTAVEEVVVLAHAPGVGEVVF